MYLIGYVLKPQGVKGEIKVEPISPSLERYYQLDKIYLAYRKQKHAYSVQKARISDRFVFFKLRGVDNRNEAEMLRGAEVLIEEKDLIRPGEYEFFVHDLIGCKVIAEGSTLGTVDEVLQLSSNDVYVIKSENGEELLIPAIKEVIELVDIKQKIIKVHLLEGMLD